MKRTQLQISQLAAMLVLRLPRKSANTHWAAVDAGKLTNLAKKADLHATNLSNGYVTQEWYDEAQETIFTKANVLLQRYHLRAEVGGDPHGYCLKLFATKGESLRGNTMGGDEAGWGV